MVLLFLGTILILAAFFDLDDVAKLKLSARSTTIYPVFACGVAFVLVSMVLFVLTETYLDWRLFSRVKKRKDGYLIKLGRAELIVRFGKIQSCGATEAGCVVALPANEFFDDECIGDTKSALGAYIQEFFPEGVDQIRKLIADQVAQLPSEDVEKETGRMQRSYGIAKCVYLEKPLGSARKILLISVTTKRRAEGLRSEPHYLFEAINAIQRFMAEKRLTEVHLPVIGSGHGGLGIELALLYMVLAFSESLRNRAGQSLRSANIMVFQSGPDSEPEISRRAVKRILSFAASVFS
jgi:hypothetical protein